MCPVPIEQLVGIPKEQCKCRSTGDPRADGTICPFYCTGPDQPNADCVCDQFKYEYYYYYCQASKVCTTDNTPIGCTPLCTTDSEEYVGEDSCYCSESNSPSGCRCPINPLLLTGIPTGRCPCDTDDARAGTTCPDYCTIDNYNTNDCVCKSDDQTYDLELCRKAKNCVGWKQGNLLPINCSLRDCSSSD
ncbi:MAG: hypothetical protein EZS28_045818, partial [Streblomastix strix]